VNSLTPKLDSKVLGELIYSIDKIKKMLSGREHKVCINDQSSGPAVFHKDRF